MTRISECSVNKICPLKIVVSALFFLLHSFPFFIPYYQAGECVDMAESLRQQANPNRRRQLWRIPQNLREAQHMRKSHHPAFQRWTTDIGI